MNNKNFIFKSLLLTKLYVKLTGGRKITQGPYNVIELIKRFSNLQYDKKSLKKELINVAYNYRKYGFHVDEYFYYNVKFLSHAGKLEFINEETRWAYYDKLNDPKNYTLFDNKDKTYQIFKKYYKRDIILINSDQDQNSFSDFIAKNEHIILKPKDGSGGKGVRLFDKNSDTFVSLLKEYPHGFIMEPILKNAPEFASFHSSSLNTIRIATVRLDDRTEIPFAFARFGTNGSNVDNFCSNGIIASVDIQTGIIFSTFKKDMKLCVIHPNSKKVIVGFKIPQWEDLKAIVKEMALIVPSNRYIAWDMVYTPNGWTLVEANARGQFVNQISAQKGIKRLFEKYINEIESKEKER